MCGRGLSARTACTAWPGPRLTQHTHTGALCPVSELGPVSVSAGKGCFPAPTPLCDTKGSELFTF